MSGITRNILSIDTGGVFCSVALLRRDGQIFEALSSGESDHFEKLPTLLQQVLAEAEIVTSDLTEVRVGIGPGSFTGLRIGLSFCKGLAWARQIPLRGYCSFAALAYAASAQGWSGSIVVASDARREEVFCAEYEAQTAGGDVRCVREPLIEASGDFCERYVFGEQSVPRRFVTPMREWSIGGKVLESLANTAVGGLRIVSDSSAFSLPQLATLAPNYLRQVAAKTIEERRKGA